MPNLIAVPLKKTKKRKPMPPRLIALIVLAVFIASLMVYQLTKISLGTATVGTYIWAGFDGAWLAWAWPQIIKNWKAWRNDD